MPTYELFSHQITLQERGISDEAYRTINPLLGELRSLFMACGRQYGCNFQDTEDVIEDTYHMALQKFGQLRDRNAAKSWFSTIFHNTLRNALTRHRFHSIDPDVLMESNKYVITNKTISRDLEYADDKELIEWALPFLDPFSQEAIDDFYFKELSLKQISRLRDLPVGTIKRRLYTARKRLRKIFDDEGIKEEDCV